MIEIIDMKRFLQVLLVLLFLGLLFQGCTKKDSTAPEPGQRESAEKIPGEEPERTISLKMKKDSGNDSPGKNEEVSRISSLRIGTDEVLSRDINRLIPPEDFAIGRLQLLEGGDPETKTIMNTVNTFFDSLGKGKIEEKYLHPEWKEILERILRDPLTAGNVPSKIRIGEINKNGMKARSNIRMFSDLGRGEGEVFLEKQGSTWYIADIQADFYSLAEEYTAEGEFEPSTYRWLTVY